MNEIGERYKSTHRNGFFKAPPTQREATPPAESVANQEEAELADFDKDFFGFELSEEELGGVNLNDVMTCNP